MIMNLVNITAQALTEGDIRDTNLPMPPLDQGSVSTVLSIIFGLAGTIAIIVVIIAGIQYMFSQGDPQKIAKHKNTIIYALVGLVVSALAFAIVRVVLNRI